MALCNNRLGNNNCRLSVFVQTIGLRIKLGGEVELEDQKCVSRDHSSMGGDFSFRRKPPSLWAR